MPLIANENYSQLYRRNSKDANLHRSQSDASIRTEPILILTKQRFAGVQRPLRQ